MTYFDQLKIKHNNIEDAYRDYIVSQSLFKVGFCNVGAQKDISKGFEIQEKINEYLENLIINKKDVELSKVFNCSSTVQTRDFIIKNSEALSFIGIDRSLSLSLMSGMYQSELNNAAKKITWEGLESLMREQNNNIPLIDSDKAKEKLEEITKKYGLVSISLGKCRQTKESIEGLDERLDQMSKIIGCDKVQLGCNRFNISLDTEVCSNAGYSCQYGDNQHIYINERLGNDAFAHEWLHSLDNMLAKYKKIDALHASDSGKLTSINEVLEGSKEFNNKIIEKITKTLKKDSLNSLFNIVDRTSKVGGINDSDGFKDYLKTQHDKVLNNIWDKESFLKESKKYQTTISPCNSYLASELDLLSVFLKKEVKNSVFYEYAKIMDKNLNKTGYMDGEYSVLPLEMLARSFEGYVGLKLQKMKLPNKIADASEKNFFIQKIEEIKSFEGKWDNVMKDVRDMLNNISPIKIKVKSLNKNDIIGNIGKMKNKHIAKSEILATIKLN